MDIEISTVVDPYEMLDSMTTGQQKTFLSHILSRLPRRDLHEVLDDLYAEDVITAFGASEICDCVDNKELVVELEDRGWKLVKDKDE